MSDTKPWPMLELNAARRRECDMAACVDLGTLHKPAKYTFPINTSPSEAGRARPRLSALVSLGGGDEGGDRLAVLEG